MSERAEPNPARDRSLLDELEQGEAAMRRRALWTAWGSVVLAFAIVVALIVAARHELRDLRESAQSTRLDLDTLKSAKADALDQLEIAKGARIIAEQQQRQAEAKRDAARREAEGYRAVTQQIPVEELERAVAKVAVTTPATAMLPRIYVHIVRNEDRKYATERSKALSEGGFLVLGIENVPRAEKNVRTTEVRHKRADTAEAQKIVSILKQVGIADVVATTLSKADDAKVRSRTFEVWFPKQR